MKVSVLTLAGLFFFPCGCTNAVSDNVREFIPGIYVRPIHNEFTQGYDTLSIREQDREAGVYFVENRYGYQQHLDGKISKPEHKVKKWTAVYDNKTHQLNIQQEGSVITFLPSQNKLLKGRTEFSKVKAD